MSTLLAPVAIQQFKDNNGNSLIGGQLFTYQAGTSIPAPSYTDATGTSANTNPVILNSRGESPLWLTPGQFYKLVLLDASSVLIWSADQVPGGFVDASLLPNTTSSNLVRSDLLAAAGSTLVGFVQSGTGAVARTTQSKLRELVSVKDFGAVGDGVTDDTVAIQNAVNSGARTILFPSTATSYRTTAPLLVVNSINLLGEGTEPIKVVNGTYGHGVGSWVFFDHPGVGIVFSDPSMVRSGGTVTGIGTLRNQPVPAVGWVPGTFDFDFDVINYDVVFDNIHLYNPTNGIRHKQGGFGRINCFNIRGFPFGVGIQIIESYDLCRLENIHFWPFAYQDSNVWAWVQNNGHAIELYRTDNPFLTNIFTIFYQAGLLIGQNVKGTANKVKVVNGDFDRGRHGILVAPGVTNHVGQYTNISAQSETGLTGTGCGLLVQGTGCNLTLTNVDFRENIANAIRVEGTGNRVSVSQLKVDHNDVNATGFPALEALVGNTIEVIGAPILTRLGTGGRYAITGTVLVDEWRPWTPIAYSATGTITTFGAVSGFYKVFGNGVHVTFSIPIITNGTGGGDVRFTLPYGSPLGPFVGVGRETQALGKTLTTNILANSPVVAIYNFDNTYAGGDGRTLTGNFEYAMAPV